MWHQHFAFENHRSPVFFWVGQFPALVSSPSRELGMGYPRRAQDAGADDYPDVAATWAQSALCGLKVNPDYEILFRLMDGLRPDAGDATGSENKMQKWTFGDIREV